MRVLRSHKRWTAHSTGEIPAQTNMKQGHGISNLDCRARTKRTLPPQQQKRRCAVGARKNQRVSFKKRSNLKVSTQVITLCATIATVLWIPNNAKTLGTSRCCYGIPPENTTAGQKPDNAKTSGHIAPPLWYLADRVFHGLSPPKTRKPEVPRHCYGELHVAEKHQRATTLAFSQIPQS